MVDDAVAVVVVVVVTGCILVVVAVELCRAVAGTIVVVIVAGVIVIVAGVIVVVVLAGMIVVAVRLPTVKVAVAVAVAVEVEATVEAGCSFRRASVESVVVLSDLTSYRIPPFGNTTIKETLFLSDCRMRLMEACIKQSAYSKNSSHAY